MLGYDSVKEARAAEDEAERLRLYYVAMTRAIDRLIVSGSIDPRAQGRRADADRLGARAARLRRRAGGSRRDAARARARGGARARPRRPNAPPPPRGARSKSPWPSSTRRPGSWRSSPPERSRSCRRSRRRSRRSRRCPSRRCTTCAGSPTARSRSSSAARTATTPSASPGCGRRARTAPSPGRPASSRPRSATPCTGCSSSSTCRARRARPGAGARVVSGRHRRGAGADRRASSPPTAARELARRIAALAGARPERPFAFEHDGVLLHGRLDVLHVDGPRALVLDYKTNSLAEGTPEEIVEADYRLQRLVYALACFRAGAEEVEVVYHFLERPDAVVSTTFVRATTCPSSRPSSRRRSAGSGAASSCRRRASSLRRLPGARRRLRRPAARGARAPAGAGGGSLMRVAALCDVHGNLPALEAVLAEVRAADVDRIVCGGDVVAGPYPQECLDRLRDSRRSSSAATPTASRRARPRARGSGSRLSSTTSLAFLRTLPHPVSLDGVLYCHGSPRDDDEILTKVSPDERFRAALEGVEERDRRRRAHARPVRARRRRDPLRQRGQRRHAVRGAAGRVLGAARRRRRRAPADAVRGRRGRGRDPDDDVPERSSRCGWLLEPEDPDEVSAYFESVAT